MKLKSGPISNLCKGLQLLDLADWILNLLNANIPFFIENLRTHSFSGAAGQQPGNGEQKLQWGVPC